MSLSWERHEVLRPPTDAELAAMSPEDVLKLHEVYHSAIANSKRDPYRYGWKLPHWKDAEELLQTHSELLVSGGNRCLAGEQEVYDPIQKKSLRVDQITEAFHVEAWDWNKGIKISARAEVPFQKPIDNLFLVELDNGQSFSCSAEHRVLGRFGWRSLQSLGLGGIVVLPENRDKYEASFFGRLLSFSENLLPTNWVSYLSESRQDALRWIRTTQDFLSDCPSCLRFYDESLLIGAKIASSALPSQVDAQERKEYVFCDEDGRAHKPQNTHLYLETDHLSSPYALNRFLGRCAGVLVRCVNNALKLPQLKSDAQNAVLSQQLFQPKSLGERFCQKARSLITGFLDVVSSFLILPCESSLSKVYHKRKDVVWDFTVPDTGNYFIGKVLQKNSGKTSWAAHAVVKAAVENPQSVIMCFAQNADVSIRQQQSAVYDALPEEYRVKVLGTEENVSYTRKNGFSKQSLILPGSKSSIIFKTYAQFLNNDTILEGAELGCRDPQWINIGAWCDEYLIGPELLATLRFRLATRNSKLVVTFTPIDGYTEVVRDYVQGAETIRAKPAELLGGRSVPYLQRSKNRDSGIIYFHSRDNPFGGYDRISKDLAGRPENEILTRAYGIATKSMSTKFPNFSREVNVIPHEKIDLKGKTKYMILDPAGRKNWFMAWVAIDPTDTWYVYREWPDASIGDWAKWHGGKWSSGEGAKGLGYGIKDYVELITSFESETADVVFERYIDPRLGAAKYQTQDGASSIIEDLADAGLVFIPAPGIDIEDGLQALQTKMAYNKKAPIDSINRPHFYISDRCQNIIQALQEYTAEGGQDEAWKDPIDVIRYLAVSGASYIPPDGFKASRPNKGGY